MLRRGATLAGALLVAWSTLAAGGAYAWAGLTTIALASATTLAARPRIASRPDTRPLDMAILVLLTLLAVQLIPLPPRIRWALSPQLDVDRLTLLLMPDAASLWTPLSLAPPDSVYATALVAAAACAFWSFRHLLGRGLAMPLLGTVAFVGLVASVAAVAQRAIDPTRLYAIWQPIDLGARPFGPFVNRNHFGTWLLLALPLTVGWLAAEVGGVPGRGRPVGRPLGLVHLAESRMAWVLVALVMMVLAAEALLGLVVVAFRASRRGLAAAGGAVALAGVVVAATVSPDAILDRVDETLVRGTAEREAIWRDARMVASQYPLTGVGLGAFERAMVVYQSTDRRTRTNQAHNQYLQLAAEGGALLVVPAAATILAFVLLSRRRLREDASSAAWLRVGALAGVVGVAVQGLWETGLRMPANGMLLALVAAVAVHRPARRDIESG
jgi:O-antigen ligase